MSIRHRLSFATYVLGRTTRLLLLGGLLVGLAGLVLAPEPTYSQVGSYQKISDTEGGFDGLLNDDDFFARSTAQIGDLNGDGNPEIAVGATFDDDGGTSDSHRGAVWILFLNNDGTVTASQKISDIAGGFGGTLSDNEHFGTSVAYLGSLGGDPTIAVGTEEEVVSGSDRGAVWILDLNDNGTVSDQQKISGSSGGFGGSLDNEDQFGAALTSLETLGGTPTLAVGTTGDDDGGNNTGAVWLLSLNSDGTVSQEQKISNSSGGFGGTLDDNGRFGISLSQVGDLDGNGTLEMVVGNSLDDDGGSGDANRGAFWILSLRSDGTVADEQKVSDTSGGFSGSLDDDDLFGSSVTNLGDLNEDGVSDLAVGAPPDDDGGGSGSNRGAVWILYLKSDGTVTGSQKISDTSGNFTGVLNNNDFFGVDVASLGDLNDDGLPDLAVSAYGDDDGGSDRGATWTLFGEQAILPVELASFKGTQTSERTVKLSWRTASEQNNAGFQIQHRRAGEQRGRWERLAHVDGMGTTNQPQSYTFTAEELSVGTHQFRLKQVDLDGTTHLHAPTTVEVQMQQAVRLGAPAPNPVRQQATLSFAVKEAAETRLTLYNVLGQKVATLFKGTPDAGEAQSIELQTDELPSGTYLVRLQVGTQTRTKRLTVVR